MGWNSTLTRKTLMKRGAWLRQDARQGASKPRKAALPKLGKKGREWLAVWRELKPRFERAGITHCEVRYPGCTPSAFLTPAHGLKRRNCTTPALLREVVIACQSCHSFLEIMPEYRMQLRVREIIDARETPV